MGFLFWRTTKMRCEILLYYLVCVGTPCAVTRMGLDWYSALGECSLYCQCTGRQVRTYYTLLAEANRGLEGLRAISSPPCCSKSTVPDTVVKCWLGQPWILRESSVVSWKPGKELVLQQISASIFNSSGKVFHLVVLCRGQVQSYLLFVLNDGVTEVWLWSKEEPGLFWMQSVLLVIPGTVISTITDCLLSHQNWFLCPLITAMSVPWKPWAVKAQFMGIELVEFILTWVNIWKNIWF